MKKHVDLHGPVSIRDGIAMTEDGTFYDLAEYEITTHDAVTFHGNPAAQGLALKGMTFGKPAELLERPKNRRRAIGLGSGLAAAALVKP